MCYLHKGRWGALFLVRTGAQITLLRKEQVPGKKGSRHGYLSPFWHKGADNLLWASGTGVMTQWSGQRSRYHWCCRHRGPGVRAQPIPYYGCCTTIPCLYWVSVHHCCASVALGIGPVVQERGRLKQRRHHSLGFRKVAERRTEWVQQGAEDTARLARQWLILRLIQWHWDPGVWRAQCITIRTILLYNSDKGESISVEGTHVEKSR